MDLRPDQWRNVTIWCPPQEFYCLQKKGKKRNKGSHFFSVFLIGFLPPPPGAFCTPKYFFASTEC